MPDHLHRSEPRALPAWAVPAAGVAVLAIPAWCLADAAAGRIAFASSGAAATAAASAAVPAPAVALPAPGDLAPGLEQRLAKWKPVAMPWQSAGLSARERQLVEKLVEACRQLESIYWRQSDPQALALYKALAPGAPGASAAAGAARGPQRHLRRARRRAATGQEAGGGALSRRLPRALGARRPRFAGGGGAVRGPGVRQLPAAARHGAARRRLLPERPGMARSVQS